MITQVIKRRIGYFLVMNFFDGKVVSFRVIILQALWLDKPEHGTKSLLAVDNLSQGLSR